MKLHEYQTKQIFKNYRLNVPNSILITDAEQLGDALKAIGDKCVLKCQVHAGGRGKAGGVKLVTNSNEASEYVNTMLMSNLVTHQTDEAGVPITSILVEELTNIKTELYLAMTLDRNNQCPTILASKAGGMEIEEVAEFVGLKDELDKTAQFLSHGQTQWLEIALVVLKEPKLVLMDEPTAGMTNYETGLTVKLFNKLKETRTLIVVEHDMGFVKEISDVISVMHQGKLLAEGKAQTIEKDAKVKEAYLGKKGITNA